MLKHHCDCRMSVLFNVYCGELASHVGCDATGAIKAARCEAHERPANVQFPGLQWYRLGWDCLPQVRNETSQNA